MVPISIFTYAFFVYLSLFGCGLFSLACLVFFIRIGHNPDLLLD
uniref:Uncharacterized protein n=1 Tax=Rhizophora mucronata TaxID=61149 RepID=A0A2P2N2T7_RHIMU